MDTAVSPVDIPLMPTPSTSSASPSVELRPDYDVFSGNTTDLSSAHTSPDEVRNSHTKECEVACNQKEPAKSNIADSLKVVTQRKQQSKASTYQSLISPEQEGIKLKIKKSPTQEVSLPGAAASKPTKRVSLKVPRSRGKAVAGKTRKRKKKKKNQSDEGSDDEDEDDLLVYPGYNGVTEGASNAPQSIWASDRMPPEILTKIFMEVTYTEGCVPTLVR